MDLYVINYIKTLYNKNGLVNNDDIIDFCEDNPAKWLKEWCGIPSTDKPLYLHIDKPIPPKPSVSIKEI